MKGGKQKHKFEQTWCQNNYRSFLELWERNSDFGNSQLFGSNPLRRQNSLLNLPLSFAEVLSQSLLTFAQPTQTPRQEATESKELPKKSRDEETPKSQKTSRKKQVPDNTADPAIPVKRGRGRPKKNAWGELHIVPVNVLQINHFITFLDKNCAKVFSLLDLHNTIIGIS